MNELWMRVGMTFRLTDEEVEAILNPADGEASMGAIIRKAFAEGRFALDGETYIPEGVVEEYNALHGTAYEACDYDYCL